MIHIFDADDNSDAEKVLSSGQTSRKMSLAGEWRNQVSISSRMRGAFSGEDENPRGRGEGENPRAGPIKASKSTDPNI